MRLQAPTIVLLTAFLAVHGSVMAASSAEVVVYSSVDDVFARPIAEQVDKNNQNPGPARPRYRRDQEHRSTQSHDCREKPAAGRNVFWSGDPVRAAVLKLKGVSTAYQSPGAKELPKQYSDPDGYWTGFSARVRVILYNTELIPRGQAPSSIFDLATNAALRGKTCIANPLLTLPRCKLRLSLLRSETSERAIILRVSPTTASKWFLER